MLKGKKVELRPFIQSDIEPFVQKVNTLEAKGEYRDLFMMAMTRADFKK